MEPQPAAPVFDQRGQTVINQVSVSGGDFVRGNRVTVIGGQIGAIGNNLQINGINFGTPERTTVVGTGNVVGSGNSVVVGGGGVVVGGSVGGDVVTGVSDLRDRLGSLSDVELEEFCRAHFSTVYAGFNPFMRSAEKINLILDYCRRDSRAAVIIINNIVL